MFRFSEIAIGTEFRFNGNIYTKVSTRTAKLNSRGYVFYFRQNDIVQVI